MVNLWIWMICHVDQSSRKGKSPILCVAMAMPVAWTTTPCGSHKAAVCSSNCYAGVRRPSRCRASVRCSRTEEAEPTSSTSTYKALACGLCAAGLALAFALPSTAEVRLPPLSDDPSRCQRAFVGNTIGQANGVADRLLDLRFCDFSNNMTDLKGKTLSAALMTNAKFDGADMTEVVMSKAYAVGASFKGTNFTNAVLDRVAFDKADMKGVIFRNTILSGSTFVGTNLENASFEEALLGYVDIQKLCRNPTLPEESRIDLACKR